MKWRATKRNAWAGRMGLRSALVLGIGVLLAQPLAPAVHRTPPQVVHSVASPGMSVAGFVVFYGNGASARSWMAHRGDLEQVLLDTATLHPDGTVDNRIPAAAVAFLRAHPAQAYVCISNYGKTAFDGAEVHRILESASLTRRLESSLLRLVRSGPYIGLNIDFEQIPPVDANRFIRFLAVLRAQLHALGKRLQVDVPAETPSTPWDGGYQYAGIGGAADQVIIMAYDYTSIGQGPGAVAPVWWVAQVLRNAVDHIPRSKIQLGVPLYGYDWHGHTTSYVTMRQVARSIVRKHLTPRWDATDQAPYLDYTDRQGTAHTIYYENSRSLTAILALAKKNRVRGIALWYVGAQTRQFWQQLRPWGS